MLAVFCIDVQKIPADPAGASFSAVILKKRNSYHCSREEDSLSRTNLRQWAGKNRGLQQSALVWEIGWQRTVQSLAGPRPAFDSRCTGRCTKLQRTCRADALFVLACGAVNRLPLYVTDGRILHRCFAAYYRLTSFSMPLTSTDIWRISGARTSCTSFGGQEVPSCLALAAQTGKPVLPAR